MFYEIHFLQDQWQHVLEAVGGYLMFAKKLNSNQRLNGEVFNFGPFNGQTYNVLQVMNMMKKLDKREMANSKIIIKFKESKLLQLNCNKAKKKLKWKSILNIKQTIKLTTNWYKTFYTNSQEIKKLSIDQIKFYENLMKNKI